MRRLLVTGFDPFDGSECNPSQLAVEQLPEELGPFCLKKLIIPTIYGEAGRCVLEAAKEFAPEVILCVGVAAGRAAVTPERIAVNIRDARIPDNGGQQPQGEYVDGAGPAAYFSTLPIDRMVREINEKGIPAQISNTAGTFVCNDVMYTVLHHCAGTGIRAGFLHVPALPGGEHPSMKLEEIKTALETAILACC